ncbi:cytochrome P450 [Nocardia rhizosphaerihabitans]|uniref:Cytochrome P450 n=1 Tax=Nocardia rhizosphaerihabitans TaxID=1691570 RepID=A0ABQ2K793_9NOCA|nr:cytochrome P450 [Nocardia rhizosphaerihabitans]
MNLDPVLEEVRRSGRIAKLQLPHGVPCWVVTGYEDARTVYSSKAFTRTGMANDTAPRLTAGLLLQGAIGSQDDDVHLKLRRAIMRELNAERVSRLRISAESIMTELLDAQVAGGGGDFVSEIARPFAVRVLCELLGVPPSDQGQLINWVGLLLAADGVDPAAVGAAATEAGQYIVGLIRRRRVEPGDDLVSAFADRSSGLDTREAATIVFALVMGGFETTAHMLSKMVLRLLVQQELWRTLRARPDLVPSAVEELLRTISVAGGEGIPWMVREPVTLAGVDMLPGDYVLPAVGAANLDSRVFDAPEEVQLDRNGKTHLTFGYASHFCVGAPIARMELEVALSALIASHPDIGLAVEPAEVRWRSGSAVWELESLPLRFNAVAEFAR